jgi:hypothetical protein
MLLRNNFAFFVIQPLVSVSAQMAPCLAELSVAALDPHLSASCCCATTLTPPYSPSCICFCTDGPLPC